MSWSAEFAKEVDRRILAVTDALRAFRARVVSVDATGMCAIKRLTATTGETELRARVIGFEVETDDEVLCVPVNGVPVVVGKLQRVAPDSVVLAYPLELLDNPIFAAPLTLNVPLLERGEPALDPDLIEFGFRSDGSGSPVGFGTATPTTSGTVALVTSSNGRFTGLTTGAVSGNVSSIVSSAIVRGYWEPEIAFKIQFPTSGDLDNMRVHVGVYSGDPSGNSTPTTLSYAGFVWDSSINGDVLARVGNGAATSAGVTGYSPALSDVRVFAIKIDNSDIRFYIDGDLVRTFNASHSVPANSTSMSPMVTVTTRTSTAKNFRVSWAKWRQT